MLAQNVAETHVETAYFRQIILICETALLFHQGKFWMIRNLRKSKLHLRPIEHSWVVWWKFPQLEEKKRTLLENSYVHKTLKSQKFKELNRPTCSRKWKSASPDVFANVSSISTTVARKRSTSEKAGKHYATYKVCIIISLKVKFKL